MLYSTHPQEEENSHETQRIYRLSQSQFRSRCPLVVADFQRALSKKSHLETKRTGFNLEICQAGYEKQGRTGHIYCPSFGPKNIIARVIGGMPPGQLFLGVISSRDCVTGGHVE